MGLAKHQRDEEYERHLDRTAGRRAEEDAYWDRIEAEDREIQERRMREEVGHETGH
jgi:hypothetical protein